MSAELEECPTCHAPAGWPCVSLEYAWTPLLPPVKTHKARRTATIPTGRRRCRERTPGHGTACFDEAATPTRPDAGPCAAERDASSGSPSSMTPGYSKTVVIPRGVRATHGRLSIVDAPSPTCSSKALTVPLPVRTGRE